jgi:hypothetical protein
MVDNMTSEGTRSSFVGGIECDESSKLQPLFGLLNGPAMNIAASLWIYLRDQSVNGK